MSVSRCHVVEIKDDVDCDWSEIVSQLRSKLSDLHYSTEQCKACNYVIHEDDTDGWRNCDTCNDNICCYCIEEGPNDILDQDIIVCSKCASKKD